MTVKPSINTSVAPASDIPERHSPLLYGSHHEQPPGQRGMASARANTHMNHSDFHIDAGTSALYVCPAADSQSARCMRSTAP